MHNAHNHGVVCIQKMINFPYHILRLQSNLAGNWIRIRRKSYLFMSELGDFYGVLFLDLRFVLYDHIKMNSNYTEKY